MWQSNNRLDMNAKFSVLFELPQSHVYYLKQTVWNKFWQDEKKLMIQEVDSV